MGSLQSSVALTKKYAAYFHGHLSDADLHRWLISGKTYPIKTLKALFPQKQKIQPNNSEARKFILARKVARLLSYLPTISTIAITGSLAVNNSKPKDDIDLMIITRSDTLWLTRLLVVPLVGLLFKRRLPKYQISNNKSQIADAVCLNLWLDESALAVPASKRNLYTAHEVLQALAIYDRDGTYFRFIKANSWTKKYLANAYKIALSSKGSAGGEQTAQQCDFRARSDPGEYSRPVVRGRRKLYCEPNMFIRALNTLAFKLQYLYMKKRITHETVTLHSAYFHPRDLSQPLEKYLGRFS